MAKTHKCCTEDGVVRYVTAAARSDEQIVEDVISDVTSSLEELSLSKGSRKVQASPAVEPDLG